MKLWQYEMAALLGLSSPSPLTLMETGERPVRLTHLYLAIAHHRYWAAHNRLYDITCHDDPSTWPDGIASACDRLKLTQDGLADVLGCPVASVARLLSGRTAATARRPKGRELVILAGLLSRERGLPNWAYHLRRLRTALPGNGDEKFTRPDRDHPTKGTRLTRRG